MQEFKTIYEIQQDSCLSDPTLFLAGIVAILIGVICLVILICKRKKINLSLKKLFIPLFLLIWGLVVFNFEFINLKSYRINSDRLFNAYKNGQFEIIEGEITVLHEQDQHGHDKGDLIKVGNKIFEINAWVKTPSYKQIIAHGGVLKQGVYARLYHINDKILRIDIRNVEGPETRVNYENNFTKQNQRILQNGVEFIWKDCFWLVCILIFYVLFYFRKVILTHYGYKFNVLDLFFEDGKRLKIVIKSEESQKKKFWLLVLNISVPLIFTLGAILLVLIRGPFKW